MSSELFVLKGFVFGISDEVSDKVHDFIFVHGKDGAGRHHGSLGPFDFFYLVHGGFDDIAEIVRVRGDGDLFFVFIDDATVG